MTAAGTRGREREQEREQEREREWEREQGEGEGKEARTTNAAGRQQRGPTPLAPPLLHPSREGYFSFIFFVTTHFVNRQ